MIVADLLAEDALQLRLHTPSSRSRLEGTISWCAPTEAMDPAPLLSRNVLVLTYGMGMDAEDERSWYTYVERLARVPVSAIAFGTGAAHRLLPSGLVQAAAALDIPLLEIPRVVSFLQVHQHITNVLQAEQHAARARSWELAEACSRCASRGSSVSAMLAEVSRTVGRPAAVIDGGGDMIARWPASSRWTSADLHQAATDNGDEHGVPLPIGGGTFRLVVRGGGRGGSLATLLAPAASMVAVQLSSTLQDTSRKQSRFRTLLAQVSDWEGVALQEFTRTFRSLGLDPEQPTFALAALAAEGTADAWKIRLMLQETFAVLRMMVCGGVAFALAQRPSGGVPGEGQPPEAALAARLRAQVPHQAVVLKGPCGSVDELRLGLHEAAGLVHQVDRPVLAAGLSIGSLLAAAAGRGARAGAEKLLAPVLAFDEEHSADLFGTLAAYLDSDCHPSRTCRKLFIHRNTLAQRLRKLEQLLAVDLDTLEGQATCLMALRIRESQALRSVLPAGVSGA